MSATPLSLAKTCCVRSAMSAPSVGSPSASSYALQQRLGAAQHRSQCLHGDPDHVEERLLRHQGRPRGLAVKAQPKSAGPWLRTFSSAMRPKSARSAELGDFLEEVVVHVEKERQPGREVEHPEPGIERGLHVSNAVGQGERDLLHGVGSGFADVIGRMEMVFHLGTWLLQKANTSVTMRIDGGG